jgi:hypothetical protein
VESAIIFFILRASKYDVLFLNSPMLDVFVASRFVD